MGRELLLFFFAQQSLRTISYETDFEWYLVLKENISNSDVLIKFLGKDTILQILDEENDTELHELFLIDSGGTSLAKDSLDDDLRSEITKEIQLADVILIDGGFRNLFIGLAEKYCKADTLIIVDNSDSLNLRSGVEHLTSRGWHQIPFWSHGPINTWQWETSLFYKIVPAFKKF